MKTSSFLPPQGCCKFRLLCTYQESLEAVGIKIEQGTAATCGHDVLAIPAVFKVVQL